MNELLPAEQVDRHTPEQFAAWLRSIAAQNRRVASVPVAKWRLSPDYLRHIAFRMDQGAATIEQLNSGLRAEVNRLMGLMPEHDTRESYRCTECGAFHLRPAADVPAPFVPYFDVKRFETAPCYLCGYNGPEYFQERVHSCAQAYHCAKGAVTREDDRG